MSLSTTCGRTLDLGLRVQGLRVWGGKGMPIGARQNGDAPQVTRILSPFFLSGNLPRALRRVGDSESIGDDRGTVA